ncbi:DUF5317 family protein [Brevibacillus sp. NRS-1366]|uniref:DUF5317 family protein n=1 Tax=Brevibacillus sp. NRS-1366 TaxID=3233899 RepID=UPI003D1EF26D
MLLDIILVSFVIAFLRGGRIKAVPTFNHIIFLVISILLQFTAVFFHGIAGIFISAAYVAMICFFYSNREHEDIRIFMIGWFLNAIVIWLNGGRMPIDLDQAKKLPFSIEPLVNGTDFKHSVLTNETLLPFLGDIIYMPSIIPRIISIGDLFIMLGAFLLVQRITNRPISLIKLREGKSYVAKH